MRAMRGRAHYLLLVVAGLFLGGFVIDVATGTVTLGDSILQGLIAAAALGAFGLARRSQRERVAFFTFVAANAEAIRAGTARYRGEPLSYATRLRVYHVVVSLLVVSFRTRTRPVLHPSRASTATRLASCAVTLACGWWGIPWGPIWTLRAMSRNVRGKDELTLGEIIEGRFAIDVPRAKVSS